MSASVIGITAFLVNNNEPAANTQQAALSPEFSKDLAKSPAYQLKMQYQEQSAYKMSDARKKEKALNKNRELEWFNNLRRNVNTGEQEVGDLLKARTAYESKLQANNNNTRQNILDLNWEEMGPDNVGGRTRAILIDNENSNKMFALSVTGGLFVSNDAGASWAPHPVNEQNYYLGGSAMVQASNGDIYFGTGESYVVVGPLDFEGHIGGGLFRSTDRGETFELLPATVPSPLNEVNEPWAYVNELASDPTNPNKIWASIGKENGPGGLYFSNDKGDTWEAITALEGILTSDNGRFSDEVVVTNNGVIHATIDEQYYRSGNNGNSFQLVDDQSGFPSGNQYERIEFAFSPENNNYVYAILCTQNSTTLGVYRSTNSGLDWEPYSPINSPTFNPLGTQGDYDICIAVDPSNKDRVVVGGQLELWMGGLSQGVGWNLVAFWQPNTPDNPYYVHADMHDIVFDPQDPSKMFVGTDGGVFYTANSSTQFPTFSDRNKGYATVQYYNIDVNQYGEMIGGAQDNGTTFIDGRGNTQFFGDRVAGGDGGYVALSQINNQAQYFESQFANIRFSSNKGGSGTCALDCFMDGNPADCQPGTSPPFIATFDMWEDPRSNASFVEPIGDSSFYDASLSGVFLDKNTNTELTFAFSGTPDSILNDTSGTYEFLRYESTEPIDSFVIATSDSVRCPIEQPFCSKRDDVVLLLDSVTYTDSTNGNCVVTYQRFQRNKEKIKREAILILGLGGGSINITPNPLDFSNGPRWFRLNPGGGGTITAIGYSKNAEPTYVGTSNGQVWRIDGITTADYSGCEVAANCVREDRIGADGLTATRVFRSTGRYVAGLGVNPNNPGDVVIALAQYGESDHVYRTTTADTDAGVANSIGTFQNITGDLPDMPVYDAVIDAYDDNNIVIGTELGTWATDAGNTTSPTWTPVNTGMASVATLTVRQQPLYEDGCNLIYAGTYGRGIFRTSSLTPASCETEPFLNVGVQQPRELTGLNIYPNPVVDQAYVEVELKETSNVKVNVYDIMGRLAKSYDLGTQAAGNQKYTIDMRGLNSGNYLVNLQTKNGVATRQVFVR